MNDQNAKQEPKDEGLDSHMDHPLAKELWENFPSFLIDRYEGQTLSEELLQQAAGELFRQIRDGAPATCNHRPGYDSPCRFCTPASAPADAPTGGPMHFIPARPVEPFPYPLPPEIAAKLPPDVTVHLITGPNGECACGTDEKTCSEIVAKMLSLDAPTDATGEAGEIPTPLCDAAYAAHPVLDTQTHRDAILLAEARLIEQEQARTIATLRDECARLREDAKLVDWLEAQNIVSLSKNAISGRWTIESVQFDHDKETHDGPLRSALAASRATEGK